MKLSELASRQGVGEGAPSIPDHRSQLQSLAVGTILIDPANIIKSVNPAAENLLGRSARRLIGHDVTAVLTFEDERIMAMLRGADVSVYARGMKLDRREMAPLFADAAISPVVRQDGWRMVTLADAGHGQQFFDDSAGMSGAFGVRAPEILSHEIKNPLSGIKGAAQLIERKLGEADQPLTRLIISEVERIAKLVNQMQSLTSTAIRDSQPCNVYEILRRTKAIVNAANANRITIIEEFDPSLPLVLADPDGLVQVMLNLLSNAVEACAKEPKPRIMISTRFASGIRLRLSGLGVKTPNYLPLPIELRVSDNGPGLATGMEDKIFSPFVTSKKNGQGLGLALVQKLVRDMNGRIVYERDNKAGLTHFRLFLPLAK